jgi:hypothetical protein
MLKTPYKIINNISIGPQKKKRRANFNIPIRHAPDTDLAGYPANQKAGHRISGYTGHRAGFSTQNLKVF